MSAHYVCCCNCSKPVCTFEDGECPTNCESNKDGSELRDGRWVCSDACWSVVTEEPK